MRKLRDEREGQKVNVDLRLWKLNKRGSMRAGGSYGVLIYSENDLFI